MRCVGACVKGIDNGKEDIMTPTTTCGMTGKEIPPEDAGPWCNNAMGCETCPHNEDEK
jgi:hypothetical protein